MSVLAVITVPQRRLNDWENVIEHHEELHHPPKRVGINPFTKRRTALPPRTDVGVIMTGGKRVATIEWDESPLLVVYGEVLTSDVERIARDVAERLDADFDADHQQVLLSRTIAEEEANRPANDPPPRPDPVAEARQRWENGDKEGAIALYQVTQKATFSQALMALRGDTRCPVVEDATPSSVR